jgi:hypothetical protein
MRAAKAAQASLFVIGIGGSAGISIKGERALKELAEHAGGRAFFPTRDDELPRIHELIAADIQQRYLLAYTPNNQRIDGAWRTINLTTLDPTHKVRARPGYFAPKPPPVRATIEFVIATDDVENPIELSSGDLELTEDGVRQDIDTFHEAVAPLSIVLAVDASGSMKSATEAVKEAAKSFVASLRPKDELSLLLFADDVVTVHDLSTNREGIVKGIDEYQASGGTALNDAVVAALGRLGRVDRRRAIVLMTDGRDENNPGTAPGSRHSLADVLEQIREVDAAIYSIGLGPKPSFRSPSTSSPAITSGLSSGCAAATSPATSPPIHGAAGNGDASKSSATFRASPSRAGAATSRQRTKRCVCPYAPGWRAPS